MLEDIAERIEDFVEGIVALAGASPGTSAIESASPGTSRPASFR